jgi:hypothetical protein
VEGWKAGAAKAVSLKQQLAAIGAEMEDFENGNENDAERRRGIAGHQAELAHVHHVQDQRDDGAAKAEV